MEGWREGGEGGEGGEGRDGREGREGGRGGREKREGEGREWVAGGNRRQNKRETGACPHAGGSEGPWDSDVCGRVGGASPIQI